MHFSTIAAAFLSALSLVSAAPEIRAGRVDNSTAEIQERQEAFEAYQLVNAYLTSARSSSVGKARGRRLNEARERRCVKQPATDCNRCMDDLVLLVVAEVMGCGVAALGVAVASGGTSAVLSATGFLACDTYAYASYDKGLIECRSY